MADIQSNIGINIDTSAALAAIKNLQREISAFHSAMAKGNAKTRAESASLQKDLFNNINATGQFAASIQKINTTTESFTNALEKNKLSLREYYRYARGASKNFSRGFGAEMATVDKVARERVKDLQSQYIQLGRDASGAMKAMKVRPLVLDLDDLNTKTQIAAQKQQIFNQLLKQGSTNLLNFGKNTQWAGRQLMVGFTIPLSIFGTQAAKTFMQLEKQAIKFKRVYGDLFTSPAETEKMISDLRKLSLEFTRYGVAVEDTMGLAADAAAMGKTGIELLAQVSEANRLAVLGNVEQAQALETTISVTNAFGIAAEDLAGKIDFLNAVENQTVTAIEDLTIAIPKAAPVVQQLGGSVEDLAFFLTAMKEGGINASEGANALKSGLASMINPTKQATDMLSGFGINIKEIVSRNAGDAKGTIIEFATALDKLDPLNRAQAIEQMFGKFQFARISTLFKNVIAEGTQAQRVLDLSNSTAAELAKLSSQELGNVAESTTYKFQAAFEKLKVSIAPIGEQFLKAVTPLIESVTKILDAFNGLGDGVKNFVVIGGALLAGLGPVFLMTFGLIANGVANIIKGFAAVRGLFLKTGNSSTILGEQLDYMSQEQVNAAAVAASLEQAHMRLQQRFTSEAVAIQNLTRAYGKAIAAQNKLGGFNPVPGASGQTKKYATGVVSVPGPKGAGDIVPAMLSPGEAVIPAGMAKKYAPLIQGMISDNLPGYKTGVFLGMPRSGKGVQKDRDAAELIYQEFLKSKYRDVPPTNYGHQLSPTSGHSFPIFGLGGVYMGPNGQKVFVKPVMDEKAALAEMRGTEIARKAHGLKAPEQRIVVIRDPKDTTGTRRFLALESALDSTFVNTDPMAVFNEGQYFKQLVASLLRVDKDLSADNVFRDVLPDVGPAGVFARASGMRDYTTDLPSMEEQAMVNLLGIKGGAKRAFAESTLALMQNLTPQQYHQKMVAEIQAVLPLLKQTIAGFNLSNPAEVEVYNAMVKRLEQGLTVDWSKFHAIHSAVKPSKPKQSAKPVAKYADGVVSVPGPKGAGDVVPAMLSPGEAVIPAKHAKKYAPLINAMVAGNIPGFNEGRGIGQKIASKYRGTIPNIDVIIDQAAESLVSAGKKITQSNLIEEINNLNNQILKLANTTKAVLGDIKTKESATGSNATHGNARKILDQEEARAVGQQMISRGYTGGTAQALSKATGSVDAYSNLVFPMPRSFNTGAMSGSAGAEWINQDKQGFMSLISANTGLDPNDPGAIEFANNVANELAKAGASAISESQFEEIIGTQIELLAEGAAKTALQEARDTYQTFNVKREGSDKVRRERAQAGTGIDAGNNIIEGSSQRSYRSTKITKINASFNDRAEAFVLKTVEGISKSFDKGLKKAGKVASPSKETIKIGEDYGKGFIVGAKKTLDSTGASFFKPGAGSSQSGYVPPKPTQAASQSQVVANAKSDMGPLKAYFTVVRANLRETVAEFKNEIGITTKDTMGPVKAYLTTVRANLREAMQESRAEFAGIFSSTTKAAVVNADQVQAANNKVIIAGKEYSRNIIADLQGRNGAAEAILTKGTAELVSKLNAQAQATNAVYMRTFENQKGLVALAGGSIVTELSKSLISSGAQQMPAVGQSLSRSWMTPVTEGGAGTMGGPAFGPKINPEIARKDALAGLNKSAMALSGMFSSLSMVAAMSGDSMGELQTTVMNLSNGMFAMTSLIMILNTVIESEIAARIKSAASNAMESLNITKIFKGGFVKSFKNLGSVFSSVMKNVKFFGLTLGRLIPLVGAAVTAFQLVKFISDQQKLQKDRIEGLGSIAEVTAGQVKMLGDAAGTAIGEIYAARGGGVAGGDVSGADQAKVATATENLQNSYDDNTEGYKDSVNKFVEAAKASGSAAAEASLATRAIALSNQGLDFTAIAADLQFIASKTGMEDIDLSFLTKLEDGSINMANLVEKSSELLPMLNNEIQSYQTTADTRFSVNEKQLFTDNVEPIINSFGTSIGTQLAPLAAQRAAGEITPEEFIASQENLLAQIASLPAKVMVDGVARDLQKEASVQAASAFGEIASSQVAAASGQSDRDLLLEAYSAGIKVDEETAASLEKGGRTATRARLGLVRAIKASTAALDEEAAAADPVNQAAEQAIQTTDDRTVANRELIAGIEDLTGQTNTAGDATLTAAQAAEIMQDETLRQIYAAAKDEDSKKALADQYLEWKASVEEVDNALASLAFADYIKQAEEDKQLKAGMAENGLEAADSQLVLNNEMLRAAYIAALANGSMDEFLINLAKFKEIEAGKVGTGSGSGQKSPYQEAIDQLKEQRKEILNNKSAYAKLRDEGFSVNAAYEAAGDSVLATALASTKVGTKKWQELVDLIEAYNKEQTKMDIADQTRKNNMEIQRINNVGKIEEGLAAAGYSAETISAAIDQIGDNPDIVAKLASDLADGEVNAQNLVDLLQSIDGITIAINLNKTPEELRNEASDAIGALNDYFSQQESLIQDAFRTGTQLSLDLDADPATANVIVNAGEVNMAQLEKDIADAQEYIASRQFQIDDFQYGLDQIAKDEEEVNKKYDDRIKALDKIEELNSNIAEGQKSQLDVATALASGDIAAAARAMQEDEARRAKAVVDQQRKDLETARENELKNITTTINGEKLTRLEIEEKISDLQDEIAKKEEDALEPKQRALDLANAAMNTAIESVTYLKKNKDEWKLIGDQIDDALDKLKDYEAILKSLADGTWTAGAAPSAGAGTGGGTPLAGGATGNTAKGNTITYTDLGNGMAQASTATSKSRAVNITAGPKISTGEISYRALRGESISDMASRLGVDPSSLRIAGGTSTPDYLNNNALVYFDPKKEAASGGYITGPGTGTSDSIPAMLSNGEFVLKAATVRKLGARVLDEINETGKLPGYALGGFVIPGKPSGTTKPKPTVSNKTWSYYDPKTATVSNSKVSTPKKKPIPAAQKPTFNLRAAMAADKKNTSNIIASKPKPTTSTTNVRPSNTQDLIGRGLNVAFNKITESLMGTGVANARAGRDVTGSDVANSALTIGLNSIPGPSAATIGKFLTRPATAIKDLGTSISSFVRGVGNKLTGITSKIPQTFKNILDFPTSIRNSLNPNYIATRTEMRAPTLPPGMGLPPSAMRPVPTQVRVNALGPSGFRLQQKSTAHLGGSNIPLRGFENYSNRTQGLMATILDIAQHAPYRTKRQAQLLSNNIRTGVEERLPGGLRSLLETSRLRHRSTQPLLEDFVTHPSLVPVTSGRAYGPGTYFARNSAISEALFSEFGDNVYKPASTILGKMRMAFSKGYLRLSDDADLPNFANLEYDSPIIQNYLKEGYIGLQHHDAYSNWLTGTGKHFTLKKVPYASGGLVAPKYMASGGIAKALGTDTVPAMLTPGEFVVRKFAVNKFGVDNLKAINSGQNPGSSVYNYSVNVNVSTDADPDRIARAVMTEIKRTESQRIRKF